jgi:hypothetical protein
MTGTEGEGLTEHDLWIMEHPAELVDGPNDGQLVAIRGIACEIPHVDMATRTVRVHRWHYEQQGDKYIGVYEGIVREFQA